MFQVELQQAAIESAVSTGLHWLRDHWLLSLGYVTLALLVLFVAGAIYAFVEWVKDGIRPVTDSAKDPTTTIR